VTFSLSSKGRLTNRDLDRFPGASLFDRLGRAACQAGCLPRKELYEPWEVARRVSQLVPALFLAGGLAPENVGEAIAAVQPFAVDACSRLESAPGKKDAERVRDFISAAHVKP
jgi:hypothetical protein